MIRRHLGAGLGLLALFMPTFPAGAEPIRRPPLDSGFHISLSRPEIKPAPGVGVYDLDLFDAAQPTIDALHAAGGYVICYFSAGSFEDWRPDAARFPGQVLGKDYEGWPGERWLDVGNIATLAPIMDARLELARQKQCDAVDADNVDGFTNETGFAISRQQQLAYSRRLAAEAHRRGLAIGLKNAVELVEDLLPLYDFAVVESCAAEDSCDDYAGFIVAGKPVFQIEYRDETGDWKQVCRQAKKRRFTAVLAILELDGTEERCSD